MTDLERAFFGGFCSAVGVGMALCHLMAYEKASTKAMIITGSVISGFGVIVLILLGPLR